MNKSLFNVFIVKYAEIGVKGRNRYMFEDALVDQILRALHKCDGTFVVDKTPGRIYVTAKTDFDFDEVVEALQHVFGIVAICPALRLQDEGFEKLSLDLANYMAEMYPDFVYGKGQSLEEIASICEKHGEANAKAAFEKAAQAENARLAELKASGEENADSDSAYDDGEKIISIGGIHWQKEFPSIKRTTADSVTFKMMARRNRKNYPKDSIELCEDLGEVLLNSFPGLKVDVHKPEMIIEVEIREFIYVYSEKIPGPGGMPVGTGGKGMLLLSGGIDSPVAGYMISKRGVTIDAVYFHAPPYTSDRAKQKVVDLAKEISLYTGPIHLHIINFTDIQLAIYEKCPHDELTIIMRRYMMRIAEKLAVESGCLGLITGESIGQVASQTMNSLVATNEVCELPVYRPLIAFDKMDIVEISEKIGTYETSILPYEDCCTIFVAKHPVTKPNVNVIRRHEHNLDEVIEPLLEAAFASDEVIVVGED